MRCNLLEAHDARWKELLGRCRHEFYQSPDYVRIEASRIGGVARGLWVEDGGREWLLPLVVRPVPELGVGREAGHAWQDAVSPYGYPHPLVRAPESEIGVFLEDALPAAREELARQRVVTVFVRLSPLQSLPDAYWVHGTVVEHGPTYWIDLTRSADDLWAQMRKGHRYDLKALQRDGATASVRPLADGIDDFQRLYRATMDRVGAAGWYYFERDYFEALAASFGDQMTLCEVRRGGELLATGLFAVGGEVTEYVLSGWDIAAGEARATKLMIISARDWARAAGCRVLHLGGGVGGGEDSLSSFKRGFTRDSSPFRTWRLVVESAEYARLVRAWEETTALRADLGDGFFPAYRRQTPAAASGQASRGDANT